MSFKGLDLYAYPGGTALLDLKGQGYSWVAAYIEAPSHVNSNWPSWREITLSGLNVVPVWVGGQVSKVGNRNVSAAAGKAEGQACVAELQRLGYPAGHGVVFDTENGPPMPSNQVEHLTAWQAEVLAGGYKPWVYGSHLNAARLADIFGADRCWLTDLTDAPEDIAPIVQWKWNNTVTAAGQSFNADFDISRSENPCGVEQAGSQASDAAQTPIALAGGGGAPPPSGAPITYVVGNGGGAPAFTTRPPTFPASPVIAPASAIQRLGPPVAAGATAVAAAGAGAVHATGINLSPLIDALAPYVVTGIVLPVAVWLAGRALQYFHIQTQSLAGQAVVRAVENGVAALSARGISYADSNATVDARNAYVAQVLAYVNQTVPARVAASGITPAQLATLATNRLAQIGSST